MAVRLGNQVDSSTVLVLRISPMPILKARCRCGVREVIYVLFFFSCLFSGSCLMRRAFFFIFILYCFLAFCFLSKLVFSCPSTLLFFFLFFFVFFFVGEMPWQTCYVPRRFVALVYRRVRISEAHVYWLRSSSRVGRPWVFVFNFPFFLFLSSFLFHHLCMFGNRPNGFLLSVHFVHCRSPRCCASFSGSVPLSRVCSL